jgi:hypothetical protein
VAFRPLRLGAPAAAAVGFAVALSLIVSPPAASAQTVATITPSFAPDLPGARTSVTFAASFTGGAGALPAPLSKTVILLPADLAKTLEWPTTRGCSRAQLQAHGAHGCPPHSQIGAGSALVQWPEGSSTASERANLQLFVGPTEGVYTLQLLAEGHRPLRRRVVISLVLFGVTGPYSGGMEASVPPLPTRPGLPDASVVSFSVTVGPAASQAAGAHSRSAAGSRWGEMELFVPRSCPAGGFPWMADFTYADGSSQEVTAAVPCP